MTNMDNFKLFVKKNPTLITYVRNNTMSWQKFYELYDLYGEDENIWKDYLKKEEEKPSTNNKKVSSVNDIMEMAKNIDTDKLQDGISSIQKAIDLFGGIFTSKKGEASTYTPRPVYRRFDD